MADKSLVGVEGITPNPSQAAFTLGNIDKFKTLNEANAAITDTNITNEAINRAFSNSPIWQKYLSDPNRFSKPDNLPLIQVERMYRQSLYRPIVEKYGDELLEINRNVQEFYRPSGRAEAIRRGYDFARYGLRVADARTKLSDAIKSGDESAIKIAQANLQAEEYRLAREGTEFESSTANAVASFVASAARTSLPLLAVELGAAALSGGASMAISAGARATATAAKVAKGAKAARLAAKAATEATQAAKEIKLARGAIRLITEGTKAAMVYDETYGLEFGGALQELDQIAPYMSEEEKRKYAHASAAPASALESGLMLVGGGANYITRGIGKLTTRAAIKSGLPSELLTDANFIKEFMKGTKKGGLAKVVAGYIANNMAEAATEEIQNSMSRAAIELAKQGKDPNLVLEWTTQDLYDFVTNLGQPSNAERERQFLDNMFASAIVRIPGGVARGAATRGRSVGTAMAGVRKNQTLADRLFHMMNNTKVGQESQKTVKDNLQNMVARGEAPSTVYLDKQSAQELIDTDPDVREAFEKLGVLQAIRESETNGGTVEIPLVEYNEVINGDSSGKLYQKVRAMVSFDNNLLSTAEFMRYIQTDANVQGEIAEAQKKADSVYNKTLEIMNTVENMDENTKKMNATIMQLITNRIAGFSIGSPKTAEEVFSKVDILTGQAQPIEVRLPGKPVSQGMDTSAYDIQAPKGTTKEQLKEIRKQKQATSLLRLKDIKSAMKDAGYRNIGAPTLSQAAGSESVYAKIYKGEGKDKKAVANVRISAHPAVSKNPKVASKAARKADGLPTIVLDGRKSLEENIATLNEELNKLRIEPDDIAAGWFTKESDRLVIALTKETNATAFAHEAFHLFADSLVESYNADALSPYWKGQAEKMFKSVGVKVKDGKAKLTDAQQETLAQDFTTYILQGKVKNQELTSLFAVMKDLFSKLYTKFGWNKSKQLDKNIRDVFNSIFNSQAEIEAEQRILGMLEFEKPEGADQTLYDRYISFLLNSRSKASQKMVKAIFAYEAFKNSEEYKARYAKEYTDAMNTLNDSMAYQIKALAATVNNDPALTFAVFSAQHPDAEITVDAIEEILNNTPEMTVEAERIANEAMNDVVLEKFGIDKETFASRALRNADKAKALLAEAMMREGKTWAEFEEEYSKLLRGVENQTARMTLSKIRNMNYWANQEARLVEQYAYYLATGDMKRAAEARRAQAALTLIRMKGEELDKRATRFKADFPDKMRFNQKKDTVSAQAWDLMQSILERYGFKITSKRRDPRPVNIKLEEWVADKEKTYFTTIGNMRYFIPSILEGHTGKFSDMQVRKFEEMEHVLKAINSLARDEFRITTEGETTLVRDLVEESIKRLDEKNIMPFEKTNSWWKTHFGVLGSWVNPEPVLEALFPERVMNKVFRPLFTAAAKAENQAQDWSNKWAAIKSKVDLSSNKVRYSNGVELKQYEVADLLLAMGTPHAYENFRLKFNGLTEEQAELVVSEALKAQPALEKFAKDTWALYAETTEVMNKSFMKRFNQLFVKKEHRKFTINGIEFEGGYVPENKGDVTLPENPDYHSIQMAMLGSEKLLVKEADGEVRSIVDNTDSRLYLFARWGYAAAEYNNVCKFLENKTLQARLGDRGNRFIYDWLKGYQTPQTDASGMIRPLMTATSMSALGFRLSTALMQLSGFIPASQVVGMRWMVRAIRRNLTEIKMESAITKAANKSAYMKARYGNPISSMFGLEAKDISKTKWVREKYQKYAMVLISYVDAMIANATWDAAYLKATESKGLSREEAILEADAAVRVSQSDSMALSRSKALQSNWARLLTPFSTYIMGMQSLVRGRIAENERLTAATVALGYIVVATLYEAVLKEAVDDIWEDDEDDDKFVERVFQTWYNQALGTFGNTIMPAMSIGGSVVSRLAYGFEEALWDDDGEMVTKVYAPTVSAMNYYSQALSIIQNSIPAVAGDDEAQVKVMLNSIGLLSQRTKKIVKEWMNE